VAAGVVRKKKKHATRCAKAATWTAEISRPTNAGLMLNLHGGEEGGEGGKRRRDIYIYRERERERERERDR